MILSHEICYRKDNFMNFDIYAGSETSANASQMGRAGKKSQGPCQVRGLQSRLQARQFEGPVFDMSILSTDDADVSNFQRKINIWISRQVGRSVLRRHCQKRSDPHSAQSVTQTRVPNFQSVDLSGESRRSNRRPGDL